MAAKDQMSECEIEKQKRIHTKEKEREEKKERKKKKTHETIKEENEKRIVNAK